MSILLTGGNGYIGSHVAVALGLAGRKIVILDNGSNSSINTISKIETINRAHVPYVFGDIRDMKLITKTLREHDVTAVIHLAGLKSVAESIEKPLDYYTNNVEGTISLLKAMNSQGIRNLVFSSSATVYGTPRQLPLDETHPTSATNPYGRTKIQSEEILADLARAQPEWRIACLRYFNPVGAHQSGTIGESPKGIPNNLMPIITQVALGQKSQLDIFGTDYPTPDGTGIRDYIHVMDLAEGHAAALQFLESHAGWHAFNLGTGKGHTVLELLESFEKASGISIPRKISPRRPGDVAKCYANVDKANRTLGWAANRSLHEMCSSTWNFCLNFPRTTTCTSPH